MPCDWEKPRGVVWEDQLNNSNLSGCNNMIKAADTQVNR